MIVGDTTTNNDCFLRFTSKGSFPKSLGINHFSLPNLGASTGTLLFLSMITGGSTPKNGA